MREALERINAAEELGLSSLRRDGNVRDPVTIWVVGDCVVVMCGRSTACPPHGSGARTPFARRAGWIPRTLSGRYRDTRLDDWDRSSTYLSG